MIRIPPARGQDRGAVAVLTAVLFMALIALTAVALDVARWYVEVQRVQNAADSAALAGVTAMPDFSKASPRAIAAATRNGYAPSGTVTVTPVAVPNQPSQLNVTVSSTITNIFGRIFGNPTTTITRSALADYTGAALMGSPCNVLANEPPSTSAAPPLGSVVAPTTAGGYSNCPPNTGSAANFWMNVAGPGTPKLNGDRYSTVNCGANGVDGCSGSSNAEYRRNGYFMIIRVREDAVLQPINVQLYDPAYVFTNDTCTAPGYPAPRTASVSSASRSSGGIVTLTTSGNHNMSVGDWVVLSGAGAFSTTGARLTSASGSTLRYDQGGGPLGTVTFNPRPIVTANPMTNPWAPTAAEAAARYASDSANDPDAKTYCTGDQRLGNGGVVVTSFAVREQTDTENPLLAAPVAGCTRQFSGPSTSTPPTAAQLTEGSSTYNRSISQLFHQWVSLCTFTPTRKGDYYLQVRTNVPQTGSTQAINAAIFANDYVTAGIDGSGNNQVTNPTSLEETGSGHNRYSVRLQVANGALIPSGVNANKPYSTQVSVSGWQTMSIYANASDRTANFNLIQVTPNAAGKSFSFDSFDIGDATCTNADPCLIQVRPPGDISSDVDGVPLAFRPCSATGFTEGDPVPFAYVGMDANGVCTFRATVSNAGDKKVQKITVPIPANYKCTVTSPGGCWYRVDFTYPLGVSDTTTWDATIEGDVVRLIE